MTDASTNADTYLADRSHRIVAQGAGELELTIDDWLATSARVPLLADLKTSGQYVMEDWHSVGGVPGVMRYLLDEGMLDGDQMTVTGKALGENLSAAAPLAEDQDVISTLDRALKPRGHILILRGNLAPGGAIGKITGKQGLRFTGPARVFNSEEDMIVGLEEGRIQSGDVIVIRYEGPKGGAGMSEMLTSTSALAGPGFLDDVALITDGRFSGGSHGFIVGHAVPEAQEGGPISLVRDGDVITMDDETHQMTLAISDNQLAARADEWTAPPFKGHVGHLVEVHPSRRRRVQRLRNRQLSRCGTHSGLERCCHYEMQPTVPTSAEECPAE